MLITPVCLLMGSALHLLPEQPADADVDSIAKYKADNTTAFFK
jgi:hypothetical protein